METSPTVFLLALFIIKGLSLECEECLGLGGCFGNMVTCDFGKDRCSVADMVLPIGLSLTIKTCVSSDVCDKGVQVINLGQMRKAVAYLKCCEGDECSNVVPPELPKKAPANGKQCPACFALGETCHEEVTDCTGDELYCAEGLLNSKIDMIPLVSLKGCANKALCDSLVGYEAMAPENSGHNTIQCTPNSSIHQQEFSTVSQWHDLTVYLSRLPWASIILFSTMKSLLFCCLFGTFLATGMCLECEFCTDVGPKCTGYTQTCDEKEDTCVTFQTEVKIAPVSVTFTSKACGASDTCHLDYLQTTLHKGVTLRSKRACCTGDECKTLPPPVLESQIIQPNGLQCPGCIGLSSAECNENLVSCKGSENQCLSISGKTNHAFFFKDMSLKSCATESLCTLLEKKFWTFIGDFQVEMKCTPAIQQTSQ